MRGLRNDVAETLRGVRPVAWVGFGVSAAFLALVVLVVGGSTLVDVGGLVGLGLTVGWLLPLAGLVTLALLRPSAAVPTLGVLTLLPVGFGVGSLVDYDGVHGWEDSTGPVGLVLLVVVAAGLVTLGLSRPTVAGALLLVATVVPVALAMVGAGSEWREPLGVSLVAAPFVITAALFLVAGARPPAAAPHRSPSNPSVTN